MFCLFICFGFFFVCFLKPLPHKDTPKHISVVIGEHDGWLCAVQVEIKVFVCVVCMLQYFLLLCYFLFVLQSYSLLIPFLFTMVWRW